MTNSKKMKFTFNVLVYSEAGTNIAHCMEMGLVATHDDADEIVPIMNKLIFRQLQFALENDNMADIFHPAPPEVWAKFREAITEGEPCTSERPLHAGDWNARNEVLAYAAV
jgi:hypothetical protein